MNARLEAYNALIKYEYKVIMVRFLFWHIYLII